MSPSNETYSLNTTSSVDTLIVVLNLVQQRFINQLPLIITVLGVIGFVGNVFTFLQPTLRWNSFCIYTLCGSVVDIINLFINLLPNYLTPVSGNLVVAISVSSLCKLKLFAFVFLPQLSMNLLIMSLIDRYACTFGLTSPMRHLLQLRMVPWLISIIVVISCLISIYAPILNDVVPGSGCISTHPTTNAILYIAIHGIMTPVAMLILVLITYRRFKRNRRRVVPVTAPKVRRFRNQFIIMAFTQAFVTSLFALQWIGMYWYFLATQYSTKSAEQWAITYFVLSLTNNLYYLINVRSFYLSTLMSRSFRDTLIVALLKLSPGQLYRRWNVRDQNI